MKNIAKLDPKNLSPIFSPIFFRHIFSKKFSFLHLEFQINKFVNKGRDFLVVKRFFAEKYKIGQILHFFTLVVVIFMFFFQFSVREFRFFEKN